MVQVDFKPITWYNEMHHMRTFFLFARHDISYCVMFTTCLSSRGMLIDVFVCHKTVSIAAVYLLKIKYDQDNFGLVFVHAKRLISFPLEDKHVVNESHVFLSSYRKTTVAFLEIAELGFVIFHTFVCKFFSREQHLEDSIPSLIYRQMLENYKY